MVNVTICSSGKARPIPSASTSGMPRRAAAAIGNIELTPPASIGIVAYIFLPEYCSTKSNRRSKSSLPPPFSVITVGAPIMAHGAMNASSGTSSGSISVTGPHSLTACMAIRRPIYGSPPPPAPSSEAPRAISLISSTPMVLITFPFCY